MKTSELINAISADGVKTPAPGRALMIALVPGVAVAICLFLAALGLRPHLLALLGDWRLPFKVLVAAFSATLSGVLVLRLFRPGDGAIRRAAALLALAPAALAIGVGVELITVPSSQWLHRLVGTNSMFCLKTIPFLALAPLIATLVALRNGAPENPALAGAAAGLFSGAIGAALYAMHCPDDSPLFVMVWYSLGVAIVTAIGAILGARLLRW